VINPGQREDKKYNNHREEKNAQLNQVQEETAVCFQLVIVMLLFPQILDVLP
jgi:hypothetical protein